MLSVASLDRAGGDMSFGGMYRGIVLRTNDPLRRNRIQVAVPVVNGSEPLEWALPCLPPLAATQQRMPLRGESVWIMFEHGISDHPVWMGSWSVTHGMVPTVGDNGTASPTGGGVTNPLNPPPVNTQLPVPTAPSVRGGLGTLVVSWSGTNVGGVALGSNWRAAELHIGLSSTFVPSTATLVNNFVSKYGGRISVPTEDYGARYLRLRNVGLDDTVSAPSDSAIGFALKVNTIDVASMAITVQQFLSTKHFLI